MPQRNLILIHRDPEYEQDFREITRKVTGTIDKDITVRRQHLAYLIQDRGRAAERQSARKA
jgi:hypothetical protein